MVASEERLNGSRLAARRRRAVLAALGTAAVLIGAAIVAIDVKFGLVATQQPAAIGGPFHLITGDGRKFSDRDFPKWLLVYFGYTHCPDICPTTLAEISQTLDVLGSVATQVQPLFVTIDPQRDTPAGVDKYVKAIDPRIIGLSGDADAIASSPGTIMCIIRKRNLFLQIAIPI